MEGQIYAAMIGVMGEVEPIAKEQKNVQQGFKFRGIDDVYAALQSLMAKHGVFSLPTVTQMERRQGTYKSGGLFEHVILTIQYRFYAKDGSYVDSTVIGEGMDSGDKASNKAMSIADKYALLQAFKIPTRESKDPDAESHEPAALTRRDSPKESKLAATPAPVLTIGQARLTPEITAANKMGFKSPESHEAGVKLFWITAKSTGWTEDDVRTHLKTRYGLESTRDLRQPQLSECIKHMEANPWDKPPTAA